MKSVCVYCGSSAGGRPEYAEAARGLAGALRERGLGLVYGGGDVGLMGVVAREALRLGVEVTGVITRELFRREVAFRALPDLRVVDGMHERKALMARLADGFVALPGGLGTLDEIFEALTWSQLGIHGKPCGFLDACGYYAALTGFLNHAVAEGFVCRGSLACLFCEAEPGPLLDAMLSFRAARMPDKIALALAVERGSRRDRP